MQVEDVDGNPWHKQAQFVHEINHGIKGAHAVVPFQCEVCWIQNLEGRQYDASCPKDRLLYKMIRRVNIDMQVARARSTIEPHAREIARTVQDCVAQGKTPSYQARGPLPIADLSGMGVATEMVFRSITAKGLINRQGYIRWETLRKKRSTATEVYRSSPLGLGDMSSFSSGTSKVRLTSCPTQSDAFGYFCAGARRRMGHESKADKSLDIRAILRLIEMIKAAAEAMEPVNSAAANELWKLGAGIVVGVIGSLRGPEIWMLDLAGIRRYIKLGCEEGRVLPKHPFRKGSDILNPPHVYLALLGHFKGEEHTREHLVIVCSTSSSGIQARWWLEKLIEVREKEGFSHGPAFGKADGSLVSSFDMNALLRHYLLEVQKEDGNLIAPDDDVIVNYSFDRTWRKSAEDRARIVGLGGTVDDAMNRWKKFDRAQGRKPSLSMRDHYSSARGLMPDTWRYAYAQ